MEDSSKSSSNNVTTDIKYQILTKNVTITEVHSSDNDNKQEEEKDKYFVEEPFDYIFEPEHYQNRRSSNDASSHHHDTTTVTNNTHPPSTDNGGQSNATAAELSREEEIRREKKAKLIDEHNNEPNDQTFKYAKVIRESDGVLEYEYKSYSYNRSFYTNKLNNDLDDLYYLNFFNSNQGDAHLNSLIRGISLSRWPQIGFGFTLASETINNENLIFISEIKPESPAQFCLKQGDIVIELDDMNPCENFASIEDINKYMEGKDNLHLMVVHESNYAKLKAENQDLLKNYYLNCEDIVIVNLSKHFNKQELN